MFHLNEPKKYRIVAQETADGPVRHMQWYYRFDDATDIMTDLVADGYYYVAIKDNFGTIIREEKQYGKD